jgi:hypothetical protein
MATNHLETNGHLDRLEAVPSPDAVASVSITSSRPPSAMSQRQKMTDENIHYPLQPRSQYMSPSPFLSFESKRVIRQAQDPLYITAPRVSHFLYEVMSPAALDGNENSA